MCHPSSVVLNHCVFPGLRHPELLASKTDPMFAPVAPNLKAGREAQALKSKIAPGILSQKHEDKDSSRPLLRLAQKQRPHRLA